LLIADRQILAIKTVTNYPWATFEELSESSNGRKHRIKGFVKGILPSTDNPMDMLFVLCPDDCCAGQKPPGSRIATCRQCKKPCDIIFNFALEISETEMSNFATTAPAKRMFCSGLNADQLLGCKSIDFNSSESIQRAVLAKWNDLVTILKYTSGVHFTSSFYVRKKMQSSHQSFFFFAFLCFLDLHALLCFWDLHALKLLAPNSLMKSTPKTNFVKLTSTYLGT